MDLANSSTQNLYICNLGQIFVPNATEVNIRNDVECAPHHYITYVGDLVIGKTDLAAILQKKKKMNDAL
jgi:hypothetical protein